MTAPVPLTYEERQAVEVLRESISRGRLHVLDAIYRDLSKATIGRALVAAKDELNFNLKAVQALQAATAKLLEKT
jgi:hypothetical protein